MHESSRLALINLDAAKVTGGLIDGTGLDF